MVIASWHPPPPPRSFPLWERFWCIQTSLPLFNALQIWGTSDMHGWFSPLDHPLLACISSSFQLPLKTNFPSSMKLMLPWPSNYYFHWNESSRNSIVLSSPVDQPPYIIDCPVYSIHSSRCWSLYTTTSSPRCWPLYATTSPPINPGTMSVSSGIFIVYFCSYRIRIETMLLKEEFNNLLDSLKPYIDAILMTAPGNLLYTLQI